MIVASSLSTTYPENTIKELMTLTNAPRERVIQALKAANGSSEVAANILFES
jgi:NACalpha-BTF3-like transcription factor